MMGSIYIIKSIEPSLHDIYVGSCKDMRTRMYIHKSDCYNKNESNYNYNLYKFIRANGGWGNFVMEEIDTCDVERLYQVEQEYIDKLNPSLNERRAYRSEEQRKEYNKEYRENNKEYHKEYHKEWYKNNKDTYNERRKEKYTCECGSTLRKSDKGQHLKTKKHKNFIQSLSLSSSDS